jgi:flagellar secretion chaperone FliS
MHNYGQNQYKQIDIGTADPGKLVILLYEGAINFLKKARKSTLESNIQERCNNINRAQAIIQELNNSLKMDVGGEIAHNLRSLYFFMERHLVMAKIKKGNTEKIDEVISMLTRLCEAWVEVSAQIEVKNIISSNASHYPGLSRGICA